MIFQVVRIICNGVIFVIYLLYLSFCFRYISHPFTIVLCLQKILLDINDSHIYQKKCRTFHKCELSPVCDVMCLFKMFFVKMIYYNDYRLCLYRQMVFIEFPIHLFMNDQVFPFYHLYSISCFRYKEYTTYETIKNSSRLMDMLKT